MRFFWRQRLWTASVAFESHCKSDRSRSISTAAKYLVELILQIILLTNRSSMTGIFLTNVFGTNNYEITIRSALSMLSGSDRSQQTQLMLASIGFLYVTLNRFFFFEKDRRHYRDLRIFQGRRRSAEKN